MVYAFLIQTLQQRSCDVLYYRFYSSSECVKCDGMNVNKVLFDSAAEKKEVIDIVARKIQMHYLMKLQHSVLPADELKEAFVKSVFMERGWKECALPVVWHGIPGLGFAMICNSSDNLVQAHNVMDIITNQLEKHLQFVSNPLISLRLIETVALIVNQFLPAGELLFMNSKLVKTFEKQLEVDLFAK